MSCLGGRLIVNVSRRFLNWFTALSGGRSVSPEPPFVTGSLAERVVFLAIRQPEHVGADLVVVFRIPLSVQPQHRIKGNLGAGAIAPNSSMPAVMGFRRNGLQVMCSFDSTSRVLRFVDQTIAVGASNLMLCQAEDWDCRRVENTALRTIELHTMNPDSLRFALLADPLVQQFVDRAQSSQPD